MKPYILLTNDDGIYSPGLHALAEALIDLADLCIAAPIHQQTGMGRSFPRVHDNGIIKQIPLTLNNRTILAYGIHGSPAFVVAHAMLECVERKPDLCICGINYGENLGLSLTCSGTVGAAFEANSHGVNAIAFSKMFDLSKQHNEVLERLNWDTDKVFIRRIVQSILEHGFHNDIGIYNVNLPKHLDDHTLIKMTKQSRMNYSEFDKVCKRNFNEPYHLTSTISPSFNHLDKNTDIYTVVIENNVSVTPIRWDISIDDTIDFKQHSHTKTDHFQE